MLPRDIVRVAKSQKLDIIGICDHNSAENVATVMEVGRQENITVLPGMEVTSKEEIHLLGLFDSVSAVQQLQEQIYAHLPGENEPDVFGLQLVVDSTGEPIELNSHLLIGATTLSLEEIIRLIHELEGVVIAAHIDRPSYSIISQLGFIPAELQLDGLEISADVDYQTATQRFSQECSRYAFLSGSDAHKLEDIGKARTGFYLEKPEVKEIKKILKSSTRWGNIVHYLN
jgi:hypothetical protein